MTTLFGHTTSRGPRHEPALHRQSTRRDGLASGSAATRVRAARAVLELAARLTDDDLAARLAELERRAERWTEGPSRIGWTG